MLQHFQGWVITETPNWDTGSKIKSRDTQQSGRKHDREKDLKPLLTTYNMTDSSAHVFLTLGDIQQKCKKSCIGIIFVLENFVGDSFMIFNFDIPESVAFCFFQLCL